MLLCSVVLSSAASAQSPLPRVSLVLTRTGTVSPVNDSLTETGVVTVTAAMNKAATDTVTVTLSVAPANEFTTTDDYVVSANKVLTFAPGSTVSTGTVTVTSVDDGGVKRHARLIRITFTASSNALTAPNGTPSSFEEFSVVDDEFHPTKSVVVTPTAISENGGVATVTAKLSHPTLFGDVQLVVQTGLFPEGTPRRAEASDFTVSDNVRLVIPRGQTASTGTVTVTAVDNDEFGPAQKRLGVRVYNIARSTVSTEPGLFSSWAILTIEEDDPEPPTLSVDATPACGTAVTDTSVPPYWALVLTPAPGEEVETEYRWVTETSAGSWIGALPIRPSGRSIRAPSNTFAGLRQAYAGFSGFEFRLRDDHDVTAQCTWRFETTSTPPTVRLSVSPNPVDEGSAVTVTATLLAALSSSVTIPLTLTAGTAEPGDFGSLSGIAIGAGSTSGTGTISTAEDADTDDETFTVALGAFPSSVTAGSPSSVRVTITDDDGGTTPTPPTVRLSVSPNPVDEGSAVTVTATLSAALSSSVTIPLTLTAGTAEPGDFGSLSGIAIGAGSTSGTGTISTAEDADTDDETFTVALGAFPSSVTAGSPSSVRVTITDDDGGTTPTPPTVRLSVSPNPVDEGSAVTVTATLLAALSSSVTIPLTLTAGTAEPGDFGSLSGITIGAGSTSGTGTISTAADADTDDETFTVALGALPSSVTAGNPSSVEVTIADGDGGTTRTPPTVRLSVSPNPVDEGNPVTVTATLSAVLSSSVRIPLTLMAGTAEPGDFGSLSGVSIGAGSTSGTGTISTADDADTDDETFTVALGALPSSVAAGSPSSVEVTILDNTPPNRPPTVSASCDPCRVGPGGVVRLTATASDPDGDPLTYAWSALQGGVVGPADALATRWRAPAKSGRVTIRVQVSDGRGGTASATVVVEVANDAPTFLESVYTFELLENEDGRQRPVPLGAVVAEDSDGDEVTYALASRATDLFAVGARDGAVAYVGPGEDYETEPNRYELTVRARDPHGAEARARVVVEVVNVNEAPVAAADTAATAEDEPLLIDVLANDTDVEGDALRVESVSQPAHGTARAASNAGVEYAPEADWHGADRFTYTVADGNGGTAEAEVVVRVESVNDAPVAVGAIPDQEIEEGGAVVVIHLAPFFEDPDGDLLTYTAVSSDPGVATVSVSGTALTLTPVGHGPASVVVTARDPGGLSAGQTFAVNSSDRMVRTVLDETLAAMARAHLASARMTLGRRVGLGDADERSRLTVGGRSVPLDGAGVSAAAEWLLADWTVSRHMRSGDLVEAGRSRMAELAADAADRGDRDEPLDMAAVLGLNGYGTAADLVGAPGGGGTEFLFAWGGEAGDEAGAQAARSGGWRLWGQGDLQTFVGDPAPERGYEGELRTGWAGLDRAFGERWLAGVSVAKSRGGGDWGAGTASGRLKTSLTAVHPYLRWSNGATSVWTMAGGGRGSAKNARATGRVGESDLDMQLGLVEVRRRFVGWFGLRADASWARLGTGAGGETVDGRSAAVDQQRLGIELAPSTRLGALALELFGEASARRDGGAGQTGSGLEVAGGIRAARGPVQIDVQGRTLVLHSAEGYEERGLGVTLSVGSPSAKEGFSLSMSSRWGGPAAASGLLWQERLGGPGQPSPAERAWSHDARGRYARRLPDGRLFAWSGGFSHSARGWGLTVSVGMEPGRTGHIVAPLERESPPCGQSAMIEPRFHCGDARVLIRPSSIGPHQPADTRVQVDNAGADRSVGSATVDSTASLHARSQDMEYQPDIRPKGVYPLRFSAMPMFRP